MKWFALWLPPLLSKRHWPLVPSVFAPWILQLVLLCAVCVLSDALVLRCVMLIFCVKEAELGTMALVE